MKNLGGVGYLILSIAEYGTSMLAEHLLVYGLGLDFVSDSCVVHLMLMHSILLMCSLLLTVALSPVLANVKAIDRKSVV